MLILLTFTCLKNWLNGQTFQILWLCLVMIFALLCAPLKWPLLTVLAVALCVGAGVLLSTVFIHMIPETRESLDLAANLGYLPGRKTLDIQGAPRGQKSVAAYLWLFESVPIKLRCNEDESRDIPTRYAHLSHWQEKRESLQFIFFKFLSYRYSAANHHLDCWEFCQIWTDDVNIITLPYVLFQCIKSL